MVMSESEAVGTVNTKQGRGCLFEEETKKKQEREVMWSTNLRVLGGLSLFSFLFFAFLFPFTYTSEAIFI